ncbi:hypothetical protein GCM10010911_59240 [Paenibacillus nasutitermitis]|uniref:Uncharacterized protein n=1 Tax=Paenibacillus nasutitermitis TaxID=1652958 RepID=A0A916ZEH5_9BACL|nr:hypothetical protein GCM10010911_59240 [Paenibacillus nasutitermitis]
MREECGRDELLMRDFPLFERDMRIKTIAMNNTTITKPPIAYHPLLLDSINHSMNKPVPSVVLGKL